MKRPARRKAPDRKTLAIICGNSGSGKTSFALRYLANSYHHHACRFIFDPDAGAANSYSRRLRVPPARTPGELATALLRGTVIFDPDTLFPGRRESGFEFFAEWILAKAKRIPGRKVFLADEVWRYCSPHYIPGPLAEIVQTGRHSGLEVLTLTQAPNRLHGRILNEATEVIAFRLLFRRALETLTEFGFDREEVLRLPPLRFVALDLETGGSLRGAVKF